MYECGFPRAPRTQSKPFLVISRSKGVKWNAFCLFARPLFCKRPILRLSPRLWRRWLISENWWKQVQIQRARRFSHFVLIPRLTHSLTFIHNTQTVCWWMGGWMALRLNASARRRVFVNNTRQVQPRKIRALAAKEQAPLQCAGEKVALRFGRTTWVRILSTRVSNQLPSWLQHTGSACSRPQSFVDKKKTMSAAIFCVLRKFKW